MDGINKMTPKEVHHKFQDHKMAKRKCQIEKDALKMCNDLYDAKYAHSLLNHLDNVRPSNRAL